MRNLVNLPSPCADYVPPCRQEPVVLADVVYGATGASGDRGGPGTPGAAGRNAFTTTTSAFVMPLVGALASVQVQDSRSFTVGQLAYIAQVGYFEVAAKASTVQMSIRNLGGTSALPAGALIGPGLLVTSGGQPGPDTPGNTPKRYACIAHREDMNTDGGAFQVQLGVGTAAGGITSIPNFEKIVDSTNAVEIFGNRNQSFRLPVGAWKIRVRTPAYYCNAFQTMLLRRTPEPISIPPPNSAIIALGNGFAGLDADGADPQRHAVAEALVPVGDPQAAWFEVWLRVQSWNTNRASPLRERSTGVASNFDDGAATPVREIFTIVEIEEL